jgi:hypothetical protein
MPGDLAIGLFSHYCYVPAPSVLVSREAFLKSGLLWGGGGTTDYIKWIELGLLGVAKRCDGAPLASWRHHGVNLSQSWGTRRADQYRELARDLAVLIEKYPTLLERIEKATIQRRYAHCHFAAGYYLALSGEWRDARAEFERSYALYRSLRAALGAISCIFVFRAIAQVAYRLVERRRG